MMGGVVAWDLARSEGVDGVTVADLDEERLKAVKIGILGRSRKLSVEVLDVKNRGKTERFLKRFDVAVSALPHGVVHSSDLAAIASGTKMVNVAFEDEQMRLNSAGKKTGALLIPGCGLAPGLGGILLGHASRALRNCDEGHILVGGLPQIPRPPFGYKLVFSIVGLLREYTDDARVFRDGKLVKVRPFSTVETVEFPEPIGTLEAFCTDGLASLVYTMKGMRTLDEKTLRWPGHAEKMSLLQEAGYFHKGKLRFEGETAVSPLEMSFEVLRRKLSEGDPHDLTVMRVTAKSGRDEVVYDMIDKFDETKRVTSMGKTTGYTASIVAQMVGSGLVKGTGTIAPETAVKGHLVEALISELAERGVVIDEHRSLGNARASN